MLFWHKTKTRKITLGLITTWPLIYIFIFAQFFLVFILTMNYLSSNIVNSNQVFSLMIPAIFVLVLHFATIFLIMGLSVLYMIDILLNNHFKTSNKVLWCLSAFFGGNIAQLIYWYLFIWREPKGTVGFYLTPFFDGKENAGLLKKIKTGAIAFAPLVSLIFFFLFMLIFAVHTSLNPKTIQVENSMMSESLFIFTIVIGMVLYWILYFGSQIYFTLNILKNERLNQDKKNFWIPIIYIGQMFSMPIYWYLYICRNSKISTQHAI